MHELSIMQSALTMALGEAEKAGASRVHAIRLRIGALSGAVPDALEFAFEALKLGTPAEGAELAIEHVPARFWCARCVSEFEAADMLAECPAFGQTIFEHAPDSRAAQEYSRLVDIVLKA